jgi:hypothetical protein
VDEARQLRDFAFQETRLADLKVPGIIAGMIDAESGLLDDLDKVQAIVPYSPGQAFERGGLLAPVWAAANAWQFAQTPPRDPVVRGTMTQAIIFTRLEALPGKSLQVKAMEGTLRQKRSALRLAAAAVDRMNKRFFAAATGLTDAGMAAADALATIPTETESPLPETLGIRTFSQGGTGGLRLLFTFEPYDDDSATAQVLQFMIEGVDAGWDNEVAVDPSGNALGPFVVGQTVRARTKGTNASGSRESGPRQLTILPPPT